MNPKIELACSLSWFTNWSPSQKEEFGRHLVRLYQEPSGTSTGGAEDPGVEDLMASLGSLSVQQKDCPSVFECQLKIFQKWHSKWQHHDRMAFLDLLRSSHPDFLTSIGANL